MVVAGQTCKSLGQNPFGQVIYPEELAPHRENIYRWPCWCHTTSHKNFKGLSKSSKDYYWTKIIKNAATILPPSKTSLKPAPVFSNKTVFTHSIYLHTNPAPKPSYSLLVFSLSLHFHFLRQFLSVRKEIIDLHTLDTSFTTHLLSTSCKLKVPKEPLWRKGS